MWVALQRFAGVVGGKERVFVAGAEITEDEADEMGLGGKPDLARKLEDSHAETDEA